MNLIAILIALYGAIASTYLLFFACVAFFFKPKQRGIYTQVNRILILLPVYKEDSVILESARKALSLHYDRLKFDVVVIADSLNYATEIQLSDMGCKVVEMNLTPRSKAKAINLALNSIHEKYDICLVLDADNYLSDDALEQINSLYNAGSRAMQCQRVAKEITTPVSVLDAISEAINNTIFRKGHRVIGLSAALAGSGMAFDYFLFQKVMSRIEATNGFDKDLEFEVISSGIRIEYLESVAVYDEKVSSLEVLQKQRTRWFAAQIINIKKGFKFFLRNPSIDVLDKWFQMFLPSRLLLFGFLGMTALVSFYIQYNWVTVLLISSALTTGLALLIATPRKYFKGKFLSTIAYLPLTMVTLITSLLYMNKARKGFIHTPHSSSK